MGSGSIRTIIRIKSFKVFSAAFVTMNGTLVSTQFLKQAIDVTTADDYAVPAASIQFVAPDGTIISKNLSDVPIRDNLADEFHFRRRNRLSTHYSW